MLPMKLCVQKQEGLFPPFKGSRQLWVRPLVPARRGSEGAAGGAGAPQQALLQRHAGAGGGPVLGPAPGVHLGPHCLGARRRPPCRTTCWCNPRSDWQPLMTEQLLFSPVSRHAAMQFL